MALGCKINERIFTFEGKDYSYDEFRALMYDGLLERIPELTAETKETLATEEGKAEVAEKLTKEQIRERFKGGLRGMSATTGRPQAEGGTSVDAQAFMDAAKASGAFNADGAKASDFIDKVFPPEIRQRYSMLYDLIAQSGVRIVMSNGLAARTGSFYAYTAGFVFIDPAVLRLASSMEDVAQGVNHELIHALGASVDGRVMAKMHKDLEGVFEILFKNKDRASEGVRAILDYIESSSREFSVSEYDEEGNIAREQRDFEEIITYAFTNREFAEFLKSIEWAGAGKEGPKTLWDKLKELILEFMQNAGFSSSALERVTDIVNEYFTEEGFKSRFPTIERQFADAGVRRMAGPREGKVINNVEEYNKSIDAGLSAIESLSEQAFSRLSSEEVATRMADAAVLAMKNSDWFKGLGIKQQEDAKRELRGEIADRLGVKLAPKAEKAQQRAEEAAFKLGQKLSKQEEAERNRQLASDFAEFMAERIAKTKEEKAALEEKWAAKFGKYKEEAKAIIKEQKAQLAQAAKNIKNAMAQANRAVATAIVGIESAREAGIDEGLAIAAKDQKMIAAAVIATINQAKMDGKLSFRQARMLTSAATKASFDNLKSLQRFMDLVDKVTRDVAYATRISKIRKMRKQAVANAPASQKLRVREFASVNPRRLDDALLDKYQEALADLNLKVPRFAKMDAIFDDVLATKPAPKGLDPKKTGEKMLKMEEDILNASITSFDDYKGLVKMINAARSLAGKALSAGLIDNAQYDAFIDSIAGTQEKFEKKYAKQIDAVKAALTQQIINSRGGIDLNQYNGDKKELILDLQNLKEGQLSSLSLADLDMLADLVSAMVDEGSMDTMMLSSIVGRAEMAGQADRVAQQINAAKPPRDIWGKMWKDAIKKNVDRAQIAFWEGKLGLSKLVAGATEMFIISRVKGASTLSDIFIGRGHEKFIKLLEKYELNKSKKERAMHKLGMIVTYLQEYALGEESGNPDHGNRDWFKDLSGYKTQITDKNIELLKEIWDSLPKDQNGNVSPKAVYDSFINGSTKFMTENELGFLREIMDWKEENIAPKQEFANELRGQTFKRIRFHMPRMRLGDNSGVPAITFAVTNNGRKISIESSTGKERVDNTVGPIETSFERMFNYNLDRTSVQYFYSKALQQVNHLLNDLVPKLNESHKPYADAIIRIIADGLEREFQVTRKQKLDRFVGRILSAANIQILFRPDRVVQELISALVIYPGRGGGFMKGYAQIAKSLASWTKSNDYILDVMNISNSALMLKKEGFNRVYEYKKGGYEKKGKFEQLAIQSASLPEIALAAPMWWVRFSEAFERETGVKFSIADFKADSDGYSRKYKQEFLAARAAADQAYGKIAGPTSQFGVRKEVSVFGLKDYKTSETKGMVLAWMSGFPASSWSQLSSNISTLFDLQRQAEMTGYSRGELATQAATEAFAIVIESIAYPVLTSIRIAYRPAIIAMVTYAVKDAFMDDEEEEKEKKKIQKAIAEGNEQMGKVISPAAIMTNGGMAVATLPLSKYGSAGRALQGTISDVLYTAAMNNQMGLTKSDGAWIAELTNETIYRKPVDLSELRGPSMLFEYSGRATATILPPLNTMIMEYEKQRKTYGPAEKIIERMLKNEETSVGEKEFVAMGILIYNAVNVLGMTVTNTTLPFSSDVNKGARELMKGGSSAPMLQQMDGFLSNPATFYNQ